MPIVQRIDDVIAVGWSVVESDLDPIAIQRLGRSAFDCLTAMVGPDQVYTRHFENFVRQGGKTDLLAAGGILSAVREEVTGEGWDRSKPMAA